MIMMSTNTVDKVLEVSGKGLVAFSLNSVGQYLGHAPGGSKKLPVKIFLGSVPGGSTERALLSVGVIGSMQTVIPLRWRLSFNGSTITREFKPQMGASLEEGYYYKALYDIKPLASRKLEEKSVHTVTAFYDSVHPISLNDISLITVFKAEDSHYSISYLSGAKVLEPGDKHVSYARIGSWRGGIRRVSIGIMLPSPLSRIKVAAGGSIEYSVRGPGFKAIDLEVPYRGEEIPVSIRYEPVENIYPRKAVITDIIVYENENKDNKVSVAINESRVDKGLSIKGVLYNEGSSKISEASIDVISIDGERIVAKYIGDLGNGESRDFELQSPTAPPRLILRVSWIYNGIRWYKDYQVK